MVKYSFQLPLHTRCKAFTVVEILAVVAILGILAMLIFPLLGRIRDNAANAKCVNNLKQLGIAMNLFAQEHDGRLPPIMEADIPRPTFGNNVPTWGPTWAEYLVKMYLQGDKGVLHCPSRPSTWGNAAGYYPDFAYNGNLSPLDTKSGQYIGMKLVGVNNPSRKILLADGARYSNNTAVGGFYFMMGADRLFPRHAGSEVNVLYLDNHVERHHYIQNGKLPPVDDPLGRNSYDPAY